METPTYVLALVLFFFLVMALIFKLVIENTKHLLRKYKRDAMVLAVDGMVEELTMVGFLALILTAVQAPVAKICVVEGSRSSWDMLHSLSNRHNCECLEHTASVGYCRLEAAGCVVEGTAASVGHKLLEVASTAIEAVTHNCRGQYDDALENGCPDGQVQAVSFLALEQVHILIFLVALTHVACAILMYVLITIHQSFWRRWDNTQDPLSVAVDRELDAYIADLEDDGIINNSSMASPSIKVVLDGDPSLLKDGCRGNPKVEWVVEAIKCFFLGFYPRVINQESYYILRASFRRTHRQHSRWNFFNYISNSIDDDFANIVGLSIEFWVVIIVFVLAAKAAYLNSIFMAVQGISLIITNTKLAHIVRAITQAGAVNHLRSGVFWFNRPPLLLIPIKISLFLCAFFYASFIFFAWQFGTKSCPFNDAFYTWWEMPWWTIIVFNTLIFAHMSLVTFPTYSMCVQMGSDYKKHMLPKQMTMRLVQLAKSMREEMKKQGNTDISMKGSEAVSADVLLPTS